jgi:hypothetical protein
VVFRERRADVRAYKVLTRVSDSGEILIPGNPALSGKEVEVLVFPRVDTGDTGTSAAEFLVKWSGFLDVAAADDARYAYLAAKHS